MTSGVAAAEIAHFFALSALAPTIQHNSCLGQMGYLPRLATIKVLLGGLYDQAGSEVRWYFAGGY